MQPLRLITLGTLKVHQGDNVESLRAWVMQNGIPDGSCSGMCQPCDPLGSGEDDNDWITEG